MSIKSKTLLKRMFKAVFLIILASLFVFAFFYNLNPVEITSSSTAKAHDPSCFYMTGNAVVNGKLLYRDIFDNKGPILFLIYALPQIFTSSLWGFSVFAILMIFVSLVIIGAISKSLGIKYTIIPQIFYLFVYAIFDFGGGYCEEISNVFVLISFYIAIRYLKNEGSKRKTTFICAFLIAAMFWLSFLVRINNAVPIGGIVLGILICLIRDKKFKTLLDCVIAFLVGTIVTILPFVIWFGLTGNISDWLYATIFVNFGYSGVSEQSTFNILFFTNYGYSLLLFLLVGFSGFIIFRFGKDSKNKVLSDISLVSFISLVISALSCILVSNYFIRYTVICFIPSFILSCYLFINNSDADKKEIRKKTAATTVILFVSVYIALSGFEPLFNGACRLKDHALFAVNGFELSEPSAVNDAKKIAAQIPDDEKDSVYSLDVPANWYALSGVLPCKRIFVCQPLFTSINEDLREECNNYFVEDPPKWVLCYEELENSDLDYMDTDITKMYELYSVNPFTNFQDVYLYKLKQE